ncbi:hypothetical protein D6779_05805 [Candidatus Parcubacteria bacterium]|nr:MAG: hypothetical protein D6779_05805 [Candidatus Parcubacteria bacterium]
MGGSSVNKELIQKAAKALAPVGIYLNSSEIRLHPDFHPRAEQKDLRVHYKARHLSGFKFISDENEAGGLVIFFFEAGVRLVDDKADEESDDFVQAEITAIFSSEYMLRDKEAFDEEAMAEFLAHNVRHHVWPYWREYVQSTCGRMGLPIIPVPHQFYGASKKESGE